MDLEDKIKKLRDQIEYYNKWYYDFDDPKISDKEYDILYDELQALEKKIDINDQNTPTKKIGSSASNIFKKYWHKKKLYSLDKCKTYEELKKWVQEIKSKYNEASFSVEYKYDGLTIVVLYENGKFIKAATRGNGEVGEEVTHNIEIIDELPKTIKLKGVLEIQGEGIMLLSKLAQYNNVTEEKLKNARNAVAGAIRSKNSDEAKKRSPIISFYSINFSDKEKFATQEEMFDILSQNNFRIGNYIITDKFDEIIDFIEKIDRDKLDFLIDGVVIKVNQLSLRDKIGYTEKFPKFSIAYKFHADEKITKLISIQWNTGRSGKITPIARLEEIEIMGATIKNATLNNYNDILRKNIKIGSKVFVRRSNDVIPEITGAVENSGGQDIKKPQTCAICGHSLIEKGDNLFCINENCEGIILSRLVHFVSKNCMNIDGVSEKFLDLMYHNHKIIYPYQIYELRKEDLIDLPGFKTKKIDNIINSINKSKNVELSNFINALSIPNIGIKTARDLANIYQSIDKLKEAKFEELCEIKEIGDIIARDIIKWFQNENNINQINKLIDAGIIIQNKNTKNTKLSNKKFVITGTFSYKRKEIEEMIIENGGDVLNSISKNTDYLIMGESHGSKFEKAKQLGIKIIDFEQLMMLINN